MPTRGAARREIAPMLSLGFGAALRRSELAALEVRDLRFVESDSR
jgi:hypothetical protein